jgi:hypothetical protein
MAFLIVVAGFIITAVLYAPLLRRRVSTTVRPGASR